MGSGWVAIATNKQYLRLFSLGGIQKEVLSLPGRAVAMAGWKDWLAVVYQTAPCEWTMNMNINIIMIMNIIILLQIFMNYEYCYYCVC